MKRLILTTIAAGGLFAGLLFASAQQAPLHTTNSVHEATSSPSHGKAKGKAKKDTAAPSALHHAGTNQPAGQPAK